LVIYDFKLCITNIKGGYILFYLLYFISFVISFFIIRTTLKTDAKEVLDSVPIVFILLVLLIPFVNIIYSLLILTLTTDIEVIEPIAKRLFFLKEK